MRERPHSHRSDPAVPAFPDDRPIIILDGHCALCSGWARFVPRHGREAAYRLLPAQSPLGRALHDPVARNRLRVFGRHGLCYLSEEGFEDRFLA